MSSSNEKIMRENAAYLELLALNQANPEALRICSSWLWKWSRQNGYGNLAKMIVTMKIDKKANIRIVPAGETTGKPAKEGKPEIAVDWEEDHALSIEQDRVKAQIEFGELVDKGVDATIISWIQHHRQAGYRWLLQMLFAKIGEKEGDE